MVLGVNSNAGILHTQFSAFAKTCVVHNLGRDINRAAVGREFNGVDNYMVQGFLEQFRVS